MSRVTVFNPRVAESIVTIKGADRPSALNDVVAGYVDNSKVNASVFIERLQPLLSNAYGIRTGVTVRKYAPKDELSDSELAQLAKCAVVVQCYGD